MKIAIIGRSELLFNTTKWLIANGFKIPLIITSKAAPEYRVTEKDFESLAMKLGAKYIYTGRVNSPEVISDIKALGKIDLAVSINYSGIIAQEVINLFPIGILNAHGGDLPRYRGNACQAWAILNKEDRVGLCIHKMIGDELDSGDIIAKSYLPIDINTRIGKVYEWMGKEIPKLVLKSILKLENNPDDVEKQSSDPKHILRTYPRNPDDGKIDWSKSNEQIVRLINASSEPFSGAFCDYDNSKMIIWKAFLYIDDENYLAKPGQVSKIDKELEEVIVITGEGKIRITEVEFMGRRSRPTEFIKSIRKRLL